MQPEQINNIGPDSYSVETPKPPKNKKSVAILFAIIFGVLFLAAVVFIIWQNYSSETSTNKSDSNSSETQTANQTVESIDTHPITSLVLDKVLGKYKLVNVGSSATVEQPVPNIYIEEKNRAPLWQIADTDKYVDYSDEYASSLTINFSTSDPSQMSEVYNEIGGYVLSVFEEKGFSLVPANSTSSMFYPIAAKYSNGSIVCSTNYATDNGSSSAVTINCGQKSKYTKDLASYITAKPFFDAIGAKYNELSTEDMVIKTGKNGYVNTYLSFENAAQLFYKAPNGQWTYFKGTQNVLSCGDYSTDALKSAFAYSTCYGNSDTTSVAEYYNL